MHSPSHPWHRCALPSEVRNGKDGRVRQLIFSRLPARLYDSFMHPPALCPEIEQIGYGFHFVSSGLEERLSTKCHHCVVCAVAIFQTPNLYFPSFFRSPALSVGWEERFCQSDCQRICAGIRKRFVLATLQQITSDEKAVKCMVTEAVSRARGGGGDPRRRSTIVGLPFFSFIEVEI